MTEELLRRARDLFDQAADLSPADQQAFLDGECPGEPELRARVEHLLACDARLRAGEGPGGLLDSPLIRPPRGGMSTGDHLSATEIPAGRAGGRGAGATAADAPGRLGRYELWEEIGRGGMGAVLRGHDPELGRDLAVKVLLPELQHDPAMVRRFTEEAQIAGQLQHPGV